jgi:hypothetical protein
MAEHIPPTDFVGGHVWAALASNPDFGALPEELQLQGVDSLRNWVMADEGPASKEAELGLSKWPSEAPEEN